MAKFYPSIEPKLRDFIERQHVFFTATAAEGTRVNLSPKGLDSLRILDPNRVAYLDLTGSGNETAAHLRVDGRLTIMMCAFEGPPNILRLYGRGHVASRGSEEYETIGARQIIVLDVETAQTSCGFGVPVYDYEGERPSLENWAVQKGDLADYRRRHNMVSIDGLPTGHVEKGEEAAAG